MITLQIRPSTALCVAGLGLVSILTLHAKPKKDPATKEMCDDMFHQCVEHCGSTNGACIHECELTHDQCLKKAGTAAHQLPGRVPKDILTTPLPNMTVSAKKSTTKSRPSPTIAAKPTASPTSSPKNKAKIQR